MCYLKTFMWRCRAKIHPHARQSNPGYIITAL